MNPVANSTVVNIYQGQGNIEAPVDKLMSIKEQLEALFSEAEAPGGPGAEATIAAAGNIFEQFVADFLKDMVASSDIPQAQKDKIMETIDATVKADMVETSEGAMNLANMVKDMMEQFAEDVAKDIQETAEGTSASGAAENQDGKEGANAGGPANWLVALAKLMSGLAGEQIEKMIDKQNELAELEGKDASLSSEQKDAGGTELGAQAKRMTELTAEIQAHTHMFKMLQETMTTAIKSIGEALTGTVRKQ